MQRTTGRRRKRADRLARRLFYPVEYLVVRGAVAALQSLPIDVAYAVGRALGRAACRLDARHRTVADAQLARVYGDSLDDESRERLIGRIYENLGQNVVDLAFMARFLRRDNVHRFISLHGSVEETFDLARRRGCIFVSGHLGNWEVLGAALALFDVPLRSIARPLDNPYLDAFLLSIRQALGQKILGKRGAISNMVRVLKDRGYLGVLVDQDARHHGVFVDFLGKQAATTSSVATLAYKFDLPIIAGYCRRVGRGFRFEVRVAPPLYPDPAKPRDEEVRRLTQSYTDLIAAFVLETPDQWLWVHRRWKTRPEGEADAALRPSFAGAAS